MSNLEYYRQMLPELEKALEFLSSKPTLDKIGVSSEITLVRKPGGGFALKIFQSQVICEADVKTAQIALGQNPQTYLIDLS